MALGLIIFGRHSGFSAARHKVVLVVISFEYCTARRRFLQAPPRKTYLNSCCPMFCTSAIFYPSPTVLAWESKAILTKACKSFQPHATHFKICSTFSGRSKTVGGLPSIISCTIAFCHPLPFFQAANFFADNSHKAWRQAFQHHTTCCMPTTITGALPVFLKKGKRNKRRITEQEQIERLSTVIVNHQHCL